MKFLIVLIVVAVSIPEYWCSGQVSPEYQHFYGSMMRDPDSFNAQVMPYTQSMFQDMVVMYQSLSQRSQRRCQFTPSCSRYSYLAIGEYGPFAGIPLTLERLWRCTESASGKYPMYGEYLFDPPVRLSLFTPLSSSVAPANDDYIGWLMKNEEWQEAYQKALEQEFTAPESQHRLLLAKLALNIGKPDKALRWLDAEPGSDPAFLRAIGYYRLGMFSFSRKEIEASLPSTKPADPEAATLWLHSYLQEDQNTLDGRSTVMLASLQGRSDYAFLTQSFLDFSKQRDRSPVLSLIQSATRPGLGQATSGFVEDGVYAFVFVAGLGLLTAQSIDAKNYGVAIVCGVGFAFTYSANLLAAYRAPLRQASLTAEQLHTKLNSTYDPDTIQRQEK